MLIFPTPKGITVATIVAKASNILIKPNSELVNNWGCINNKLTKPITTPE